MKHKSHNVGENHPRARFSDKMIKRMRELKEMGVSIKELSNFYKTTYNHMYKLTSEKHYFKHLN